MASDGIKVKCVYEGTIEVFSELGEEALVVVVDDGATDVVDVVVGDDVDTGAGAY